MFKFRPTMTTLEKRENPADFQPMNPIFLTEPGHIFPSGTPSTTGTTDTTTPPPSDTQLLATVLPPA